MQNQSWSEDQTYVVQPINVAKPENTLQNAFDTLINKPFILEHVLEPVAKPILDLSNMDISHFDEEDEHVIHVDTILGSFSASVSILEPELDTPSSSTSQNIQELPIPPSPQPINVPPPPTHFTSIYLS